MPPPVAALVFALGILGLFWLDRGPEARTSKALWIPVAWLFISSSRPVSFWLGMTPTASTVDVYLEGSPIDRAVYVCLLFVGLVVLLSRSAQVGPILRRNWAILLFFSYAAASIVWSDFPFVTLKHWIKGVGDLVMVLIVVTDPAPAAAFKRILTRVGFVVLPLSVLFIKYYPNLGREYNAWTWVPMYGGVTLTKNELGVICLVFGLGSLWRFLVSYQAREDTRRSRLLIAHGTILAMTVWLLWKCNSMTSLSCLLMAGAMMVLVSRPGALRRPSLVHLAVAAMVCLSIFALFLDPGGGLVQTLGRDSTLTGRTDIWRVVLSVPVSRLVGAGYESFWLGDRLQKVWSVYRGIQEAHNGYLEMLLNLGWIGIALLAIIIVKGYRTVVAAFRQDPTAGSLRVAYFAAALVYSFTEAGFRMLFPLWFFFLLATTAVPDEFALREGSPVDWAEHESPVDRALGVGLGEGCL